MPMIQIDSAELARLRRVADAAARMYAQITGKGPFITGASENGEGSLPTHITVCPVYGSDVTGIYKLVRQGSPEW